MNYYKKYLKYKNKYLYLKGGKPIEPVIEPVIVPIIVPIIVPVIEPPRIEPNTGTELPRNPQVMDIHIMDEEEVEDFYTNYVISRRNYDELNENYYDHIAQPLRYTLIQNRINLVNLRNYIERNLQVNEYINISFWFRGDVFVWARNNNGNIEYYACISEEYQNPQYSGLARFLTEDYTPSLFFTRPRRRPRRRAPLRG